MRIRFLFATGRQKGLEALVTAARELFGHGDIEGRIISPVDVPCFRSAAGVFADKQAAERAQDAFRRVGRLALADKIN